MKCVLAFSLVLLLPKATQAADFTGPGMLSCPAEDIEQSPCDRPNLLGSLFDTDCGFECFDLTAFLASLATNLVQGEKWTYPLPCDCVTLTACPESCELIEAKNVTMTSFQGPGTVTCPFDEAWYAPCELGLANGIFECFTGECTTEMPEGPDEGSDKYTLSLPCECMLATCPDSCSFEASQNTTSLIPGGNGTKNFNGIGTVSCPIEDFITSPCFATETDCAETCGVDVSIFSQGLLGGLIKSIFVSEPLNYTIPLGCECVKVESCADSCTFAEGELPGNAGEPLNLVNFTGPGLLSCPVDSYFRHPCFPTFDDQDGACEIECGIVDVEGNVTQGNFNIPLGCECMVVNQCPDTCRFLPGTIQQIENPFALAKKNFTGAGTVRCSVLDHFLSPCELDKSECNAEDNCSFDTVSDILDLEFVMTMNCTCQKATCAETCEYDEVVEEFPDYDMEFAGPGIVRCPARDYFRKPCLPNLFEAGGCALANSEECLRATEEFSLPRNLLNLDGSFELPLSCSCVSMGECANTCVLESVEEPTGPTSSIVTQTPPVVAPTERDTNEAEPTTVSVTNPTAAPPTGMSPTNGSGASPTAASPTGDSPTSADNPTSTTTSVTSEENSGAHQSGLWALVMGLGAVLFLFL